MRAVAFSDPLMLVSQAEGGRREGMGGKGNPVWPVCRYIYILPAGGPGEAKQLSEPAHTHPLG